MRKSLFPNLKKMTTFFCIGIVAITFMTLGMRLTFLSGMAITLPAVISESSGAADTAGKLYQINPKVYFATVETKGNILIVNSGNNTSYIRVDLTLNKTGKSIYYSGDISPGTTITSVRLQGEPPEDGVYDCTATITSFDPKTKDKISTEKEAVKVYIGQKP